MRSIAVFLLFALAAGVQLSTVSTEQSIHEAIMRRQMESEEAFAISTENEEEQQQKEVRDAPIRERPSTKKKKRDDSCEYRYVLGDDGAADCTSKTNTRAVQGAAKCEEYAEDIEGDNWDESKKLNPFILTNASGDFVKYPWNCFKTDGDKYGYNPSGLAPTAVGAGHKPICEEVTYINGTQDTNECGNDDYENIMVEGDCRTALRCEALMAHHQFRDSVLNGSEAAAAPKGCHIEADGEVRFSDSTTGCASGSCAGVPICVLSCAAQGTSASACSTSR